MIYNKNYLVEELRAIIMEHMRQQPSKSATEEILEQFIDFIKTTVEKKGDLNIGGFGAFKMVDRKARQSRNPKNGEVFITPAHKKLKFFKSKSWDSVK